MALTSVSISKFPHWRPKHTTVHSYWHHTTTEEMDLNLVKRNKKNRSVNAKKKKKRACISAKSRLARLFGISREQYICNWVSTAHLYVDINQLASWIASHKMNQITSEIRIMLSRTNPLQTDPSLYSVIWILTSVLLNCAKLTPDVV